LHKKTLFKDGKKARKFEKETIERLCLESVTWFSEKHGKNKELERSNEALRKLKPL